MKKTRLTSLIAGIVAALTSCNSDPISAITGGDGVIVNEYCSYQCSYTLDFSYGHTVTPLHDALSGYGANLFAIFSVEPNFIDGKQVGHKLYSHLYGGKEHVEVITEEILNRQSRVIGISNGLIVGTSSLQEGQLYVFDQLCPNCYKSTMTTRPEYKVDFVDNGTNVVCPTCQRTYGLLNGGVVVAGTSGEKLFRYHASYNGTVFYVRNPM